MSQSEKIWVLDAVKDITVAKVSNSDDSPCQASGKNVSDFMEEIYNKLNELVEKSINDCK